jgi:hypothetical protein
VCVREWMRLSLEKKVLLGGCGCFLEMARYSQPQQKFADHATLSSLYIAQWESAQVMRCRVTGYLNLLHETPIVWASFL